MGCLLWVSGRVDHVIMVSRCTCHHKFIVCAHKSERICSTICTIYLSGRYFPTIHLCIGISKWKHYKIWFKMPNIYSIGGISHRRNMWKMWVYVSTQYKQMKQEELICQGNVQALKHAKSPIHKDAILLFERNVKCTRPVGSNRKRFSSQNTWQVL